MHYVEFYITKDRFAIYTLLATGATIDGYENKNGATYIRFEDKKKCEKILTQLLSKKLKIYAHDFVNAMRDAQAIFKSK